MCDEKQVESWGRAIMSRRRFGVAAGAATAGSLAGCAMTGIGSAASDNGADNALSETMVAVPIGQNTMDAFFVHPTGMKSPAVLFWPDIAGIRESKRRMARRLAREGYAVLVANPYYRDVSANQFSDFAGFAADGGFQKVRPWRERLDAEAVMGDARAAIAWLDEQPGVDGSAGVGSQGYCMGGPFAMWTAAAVPERVRAAASFHGGGLVRDGEPTSPHAMFTRARASYLIAIAQDDAAKAPDHARILADAAQEAGRPAEIDVYAGDHGWTVPDSPSYAREPAERAYADLLTLYARAL